MHTPLPWTYNPVDGEILANKDKLLLVGVSLPCGSHPREDEAIANAKYIVQAVNSHEALVEALKNIIAYRKRAGAIGFQLEKLDDFLRNAEHVLALAEGKVQP